MGHGYYSDAFRMKLLPPKENVGTELGKAFMELGALADENYKRRFKERQIENRQAIMKQQADSLDAWRQAQLDHLQKADELAERQAESQKQANELQWTLTGNKLADMGAVAAVPDYDSFDDWKKHFTVNDPKLLTEVQSYFDAENRRRVDEYGKQIVDKLAEATNGEILGTTREEFTRTYLPKLLQDGKIPDKDILTAYKALDKYVWSADKSNQYAPTALQKNCEAINEERAKKGLPPRSIEECMQFQKMTGLDNVTNIYTEMEKKVAKEFGKDYPVDFYQDFLDGKITYADIVKNKDAYQDLYDLAKKNKVVLKNVLPKSEFQTLNAIRDTNDLIKALNKDTNFKDHFGPVDSVKDWIMQYVNLDDDAKNRARKYFTTAIYNSAMINANIRGVPSNKDMELIAQGLPKGTISDEEAAQRFIAGLEKNLQTLKSIERTHPLAAPQFIVNYGAEEQRIRDSIEMIKRVFGLDKQKPKNGDGRVLYDPKNAAAPSAENTMTAPPAGGGGQPAQSEAPAQPQIQPQSGENGQPRIGQIIINPKTGEKRRWNGHDWEVMR